MEKDFGIFFVFALIAVGEIVFCFLFFVENKGRQHHTFCGGRYLGFFSSSKCVQCFVFFENSVGHIFM